MSQLDAVDYTCVPATWVMADLTPGHWDLAVAALPRWFERVQFTARGQAFVARLSAFLPLPSREELAELCDMSQTLATDLIAETPLDTLIMDERNAVLINAVKRFHTAPVLAASDPLIVGVLYGAAHMPAVAEYLAGHLPLHLPDGANGIEPPVFT